MGLLPERVKTERRKPLTLLKDILIENNLGEGLKFLTLREQQVLSLYYLQGYKEREIANFYNITQQAISYLRK